MITIEQMVQREVLCCMSNLISTLAQGYLDITINGETRETARDLHDLAEQAVELMAPVLDYEEAALQVGWVKDHSGSINPDNRWSRAAENGRIYAATAEQACELSGIDPYEWEVYEHWAVSQWLAEKLVAHGERVDTDFACLNIWARTTTGQVINVDGVVRKIYAEMTKT
jgi:hypothetical protein